MQQELMGEQELKPEQYKIDNHDDIFQLLFNENDITWKTVILELVRQEKMNPWDIDVSSLTQKYIETVKRMKELDFRVSGKVLLAAAILLKLKSNQLVDEDITNLDSLISSTEEVSEDKFYEELDAEMRQKHNITPERAKTLIPKVPQPRKRKVSIYDLVGALDKALEVKKRRVISSIPSGTMIPPAKTTNISEAVKALYGKIKHLFGLKVKDRLLFTHLIPSDTKEDKVLTFIPLLHLTNQKKIHLQQDIPFGDIEVFLRAKAEKEVTKELNAQPF